MFIQYFIVTWFPFLVPPDFFIVWVKSDSSKHLKHCLSMNAFVSPAFWGLSFIGYRTWGWQLIWVSLEPFKSLILPSLASTVCWRVSCQSYCDFPLRDKFVLSGCFQDFLSIFVCFQQFYYDVCILRYPCVSPTYSPGSCLDSYMEDFHPIWTVCFLYFFTYTFCSACSLHLLLNCVGTINGGLCFSEASFLFSLTFSPPSSDALFCRFKSTLQTLLEILICFAFHCYDFYIGGCVLPSSYWMLSFMLTEFLNLYNSILYTSYWVCVGVTQAILIYRSRSLSPPPPLTDAEGTSIWTKHPKAEFSAQWRFVCTRRTKK